MSEVIQVSFRVVDADGRLIQPWVLRWQPEQVRRWRIRRAPAGAVPPWRQGALPDDVLADEDGRVRGEFAARWWIWRPGDLAPDVCVGRFRAALDILLAVSATTGSPRGPLVGRGGGEPGLPSGVTLGPGISPASGAISGRGGSAGDWPRLTARWGR